MSMLPDHARTILQGRYTRGNEQPEDIFKRVAHYYGSNYSHTERLLDYFNKLWAIPASPILSNGGSGADLPISCFINYIPDDRQGLMDHLEEFYFMGTNGGGIGSYAGAIRSAGQVTSRGTTTSGAVQFLHTLDSLTLSTSQGANRQAPYVAYFPTDHPEILEFIAMRNPNGGDTNRRNLNIHSGLCLSDKFMEAVENNEMWELVDPHSKEIIDTIPARMIWQQFIETRVLTGEPYAFFVDSANRALHPDLIEQGLKIHSSNLCSEIMLTTDEDRSAVCCLSSLNLEFYDDWKDDPNFVGDMIEFLDNVLEDFIKTAPVQLSKAVYSAVQERSIGLGTMGWHSYLQKNNTPIESVAAIGMNKNIFQHIKTQAKIASDRLAKERGPAAGLKKDRHANLLAIAPNASTSIIAGTSPSIEPWAANIFVQHTVSGPLTMRNKFLDELLRSKGTSEEVDRWWKSILENDGSVQHLDCLDAWEKDVYKTAFEINQAALVRLACDRQKWLCQAQSLNLFFPAGAPIKYIHNVHMQAWKGGLKSLYYARTQAAKSNSVVSFEAGECLSCQG